MRVCRFLLKAMLLTQLLTQLLVGCGPWGLEDSRRHQQSEASMLGPMQKNLQRFLLYRLSRQGEWQKAQNIEDSSRGVTLLIHGFKYGDQKSAFLPKPIDVNRQFGLVDYAKPDCRLVEMPTRHITTDIYALMWDSRFRHPIELEHILLNGRWDFGRLLNHKGEGELKNYLDSDHIDDETDGEFFSDLYRYYDEIFAGYRGMRPKIAGFSKGAHLAIKLLQQNLRKSDEVDSKPISVALLDIYVGPSWANGNIGEKLLRAVRQITAQNIPVLNISSSSLDQVAIGPIELADQRFRQNLREEVGELKIERNDVEKKILTKIYSKFPLDSLRQVALDHTRAAQFFIGSSLVCAPEIPTINSQPAQIGDFARQKKQKIIITPSEVTRWIYFGFTRRTCQTNF